MKFPRKGLDVDETAARARTKGNVSLERAIFDSRFIKGTAFLLVAGVVILIGANIIFKVWLRPEWWAFMFQINLDGEGNFATWYNSILFLFASTVAFVLAWMIHTRTPDPAEARVDVIGWLFTALVFLYLAVDDAAQIHDIFSVTIENVFEWSALPVLSELGWYSWIPVYVLLGVLSLAAMFVFFRRNIWRVRSATFLVLLGVFLFALNPVTEVLENRRVDLLPEIKFGPSLGDQLLAFNDEVWVEFQFLIMVEESSEMPGAICFLIAFMIFGEHLVRKEDGISPA
jgi:hypothetical protein